MHSKQQKHKDNQAMKIVLRRQHQEKGIHSTVIKKIPPEVAALASRPEPGVSSNLSSVVVALLMRGNGSVVVISKYQWSLTPVDHKPLTFHLGLSGCSMLVSTA